jgi:hypothetical protein
MNGDHGVKDIELIFSSFNRAVGSEEAGANFHIDVRNTVCPKVKERKLSRTAHDDSFGLRSLYFSESQDTHVGQYSVTRSVVEIFLRFSQHITSLTPKPAF